MNKLKKQQQKLRQEVLSNTYSEDTKELMLEIIEDNFEDIGSEFDDLELLKAQISSNSLTKSEDLEYLLEMVNDALEDEMD